MSRLFIFLFLFGMITNAQHQDKLDFSKADITITVIPAEKRIDGRVVYHFEVLQDVDSLFLDAIHMDFKQVDLDENPISYTNTDKIVAIKRKFKRGEKHRLVLKYTCIPKQTVYFLGWEDEMLGNEQIWTQGQGKYTSHWLPSFDDMNEKVAFDLSIETDLADRIAIANGAIKEVTSTVDGKTLVSFDMEKPMSSYLLAFAIGNYERQDLKSKSGIPIENYYYPQDSLRAEPTFRYTQDVFDFLEKEIGVPYPWQNYKQIPVSDFLYAGMENTTATIFSDRYVIDSTAFVDTNYVNVNAHELAHQWFGNLVTEKNSTHHWLHEGFATYYAYLTEKELFGDDHFYWIFYRSLQQLKTQEESGNGQRLLDPKASSLTFYEKGAWALLMLRNAVGDKGFKKGVKNYLKRFQFKNVTVDDFLKEVEDASGKDLTAFRKEWLESTEFPFEKAKNQLAERAPSIRVLFELERNLKADEKADVDYLQYWNETKSIHLKKELLGTYSASLPVEIYDLAFASDTVPIRQALFSDENSDTFLDKEKLQALLDDASYVTKENALFALWQAYPKDRGAYLDATKEVVGLPNKNIRILWLTLAMLSENYNARLTKVYFEELSSYTGQEYAVEIRQRAFFYLKEAFGLNERSLTNLVKASAHHAWQFRKYARGVLDDLLKDPDYKARLEKLVEKLNAEESRYLLSKLEIE